ncbi:hypothetical protein FAZ69_09620 [Trinickia terrae]|uniref:DegT/DnrJ/EryC1/StrS aminotransferase family protein n=1 Tax=Trinickia terrae TaxID=2571161 RepID=A0A4U1I738_9BURK|nr:hypothetical protein [Trinickia terrae]TKC89216.1 hypothetical protein FAZ69_09620 [Trinickia terrae]
MTFAPAARDAVERLSTRRDAIGGYFELELPPAHGELYPNALRFQSARAAFLALLTAGRPQRVWMPWYICESMLEAHAMTGVQVQRYQIDEHFEIASDIALGENDWLLYVNYFGVCDARVERLFARFPRQQTVIDNSQALFSPPVDCLATIYSPRKFFGIPDGGYLVTERDMPLPDEQDTGSIERFEPLLMRLDHGAEAGYQSMVAARTTLRGQSPKRMSELTRRLLAHIDYPAAIARRNRNYARYQRLLGADNALPLPEAPQYAPLCYPFWNYRADLHARLAAQRVYVAKYWPHVRGETGTPADLEYRLATECLALPCDQRYGDEEIDFVVAMLCEAIKSR